MLILAGTWRDGMASMAPMNWRKLVRTKLQIWCMTSVCVRELLKVSEFLSIRIYLNYDVHTLGATDYEGKCFKSATPDILRHTGYT